MHESPLTWSPTIPVSLIKLPVKIWANEKKPQSSEQASFNNRPLMSVLFLLAEKKSC